ncbi:DUF6011 domain-containing protein [Pseudofrankia inefficax]|uniref:Uncharacterized protein n=1 Tax=Pseudofrankia inefficax (strain DSM 45817 / CECT 9037 / DDB 130130 / EuI1c) TaxID=298654 RepID=E3J650_PSEI1|nr:DUF6011 domain-containing protein [Pseudofrankia inefficax]ADP78341.1 hypothetical protein FraEuI1c_0255 [Pseudofrankia inefficax]
MTPTATSSPDGPPRCRICCRALRSHHSAALGMGPTCARRVDPDAMAPLVHAAHNAAEAVQLGLVDLGEAARHG